MLGTLQFAHNPKGTLAPRLQFKQMRPQTQTVQGLNPF